VDAAIDYRSQVVAALLAYPGVEISAGIAATTLFPTFSGMPYNAEVSPMIC